MRIELWTTLAAVSLTLASVALASGQQVGNGGHVVHGTCYVPEQQVHELLDFYEGRRLRGWSYDLGGAGLSIYEKAEIALDRLARVDAARAARYRGWLASFPSEMSMLPIGIRLTDTADTGSYEIPSGCNKGQLAKQMTPASPEDRRYFIDATNWGLIDDDSKAGLILHEIVYRDALERGHHNSARVRYVVGLISSPYLDTLTQQQYFERMRDHFMIGYTWTYYGDGSYHFRYFEELLLDQAAAKQFCDALPGHSFLASSSFWSAYWNRFAVEAIGRKILGEDGLGTIQYWIAGTPAKTQSVPGWTQVDTDPTTQHSVICHVVGPGI